MSFGVCVNCQDVGEMEQAHIIPRSLGGKGTVLLCPPCHALQHSMRDRQDISTLTKLGMARLPPEVRDRMRRGGRPVAVSPDAVSRARELRASGLTLWAVCEQLTAEGVPTATGGKWWPATVSKMLARAEREDAKAVAARA